MIEGKTILKEIRQDLTYNELDTSIENLWSVLFTTGYLTRRGRIDSKKYQLAIPNREVREIFRYQIKQWFQDASGSDPQKLNNFCEAFPTGNTEKIEQQFNEYLWNSISIRDTFVKKERKENFYHGILLGLLQYKTNWLICSNAETGEGYSDLLVEVPESRTEMSLRRMAELHIRRKLCCCAARPRILYEIHDYNGLQYAENDKLDAACTQALKQIEDKKYETRLIEGGMQTIIRYGIACYRKHCKVMRG